ncbi:DEAD/DEAH box helicase [Fluviicola taffensis]|uniref:DEAD/DEAH box helicase domain protein n=1 Tax=Fluviicola taffensis (strain DSM 16823 / NCIMB 13979 / RW262) TaxID=755732 RepID=F2II13_FLUTR|nr:DEAD/DEAH box helicase [Fluviicola taffensis]AEA42713.1 DEAD/DEAH box helicase domain protein [Fluviicola taffensis DSM 16823]
MKFEELNKRLENTLVESGLEAYTEKQEKLVKLSKQGKNQLFFTALDDELIQGLHYISFMRAPEMLEGSPRVLWFTPTWESAREKVKSFQNLMKRTDVTIEIADNKGKIIEQRNAIFEGAEILIGNPKRLLEIYTQNGIHVNQLSLVIIDDADILCKDPLILQMVKRIAESLPKCQKLIFANKEHHRLEAFCEEICTFYEISDL